MGSNFISMHVLNSQVFKHGIGFYLHELTAILHLPAGFINNEGLLRQASRGEITAKAFFKYN